jgi:hypothetical protein
MATGNTLFYGLDPTKYPSRMGQCWNDEEITKLLVSIQKKKSIEEIAKEHDRTVGSIKAYIHKLAADYHFNDKRPVEEIQTFTGLTKAQVEDAIKKREIKEAVKKISKNTEHNAIIIEKEKQPTMLEVMALLKDIQGKLNILLEKNA